jgi:hypothetical protein
MIRKFACSALLALTSMSFTPGPARQLFDNFLKVLEFPRPAPGTE